jgi:hypothetical protein
LKRTGTTLEARQATTGRVHQADVTVVSGADAGIGDGKPHGILALHRGPGRWRHPGRARYRDSHLAGG